MRTRKRSFVFVLSAVAAVIVGWFWRQHDHATLPEPVPEAIQANEPTIVAPVPVAPPVAEENDVMVVSPALRPTSDDEMAARVLRMADRMYTTVGPQFVEHLASKGLSPTDSERVVADAMPDWVRCQLDATLAQADEQSISRADVLAVIDSNGLFSAPPALDMRAAIARALPCRLDVQQRMGISPGNFELRATGR